MSPLVRVGDVNVDVENNCVCPCFPKKRTPQSPRKVREDRIEISEPRLKTDDKIKKATCNIV